MLFGGKMISAQECRDKLQREREKIYQKQKEKCIQVINNWIRLKYKDEYISVYFDLPPHPKLISELKRLGYATKTRKLSGFYKLFIFLPQDVENTSLQDESSNVKEPSPRSRISFKAKIIYKKDF